MTAILQALAGCVVVVILAGVIAAACIVAVWGLMLHYLGIDEDRRRATPLERLARDQRDEEQLRRVMATVDGNHGRNQCQ